MSSPLNFSTLTRSSPVTYPCVLFKCCLCRFYKDTVLQLVDALGWGVVVLHDAKGMFPEDHPAFLGTYSPYYTSPVSAKQCYEAADAILFVGKPCASILEWLLNTVLLFGATKQVRTS